MNTSAIADRLSTVSDPLPESIHPFPDLLELSPDQVVERYRVQQMHDFQAVFRGLEKEGGVLTGLPRLAALRAAHPFNPLWETATSQSMLELFMELHAHVMGHPVWVHPFFRRFCTGALDERQLAAFLCHYLNQVKNTRQCVALSCGRFHSLADLRYGALDEAVSELVQVVLAGLLADEYGTEAKEAGDAAGLNVVDLTDKRTHIVLYRQMFELVDIPLREQDVPLLPAVADNVLVQRILAGSDEFTELESLASVGLGMEWGVPSIFSMLLAGVINFADARGIAWTPRHLEVLTGHVRQDVEHAVSVMLATALLVRGVDDRRAIKNVTNILMSSRYEMMTGIHEAVFGQECASIHDIDLAPEHRVGDRRIADVLPRVRSRVNPALVSDHGAWLSGDGLPFVFDTAHEHRVDAPAMRHGTRGGLS